MRLLNEGDQLTTEDPSAAQTQHNVDATGGQPLDDAASARNNYNSLNGGSSGAPATPTAYIVDPSSSVPQNIVDYSPSTACSPRMSTIPIPEDVERHQTPHASHTYPAPVTRYNTSARSASVSPIPPALVHQPDYLGPPLGPQHPPDLLPFNSTHLPPSELRVSDSTEPSMPPKSVSSDVGPEESLAYGHTNTVPRSLSISTPKLSEPSSIPMDNPRRASWMVPFASTGRHFDIGSSLLQAELTAPQTSSFQQTLAGFILWDTHSSRIPSQYYISTFRGTSQYAVGGLSACGFACLLAAKRILLLGRSCRSGSSEVSEFARTIDDVRFHQSIIEPCAKLDSTSHFEVEDILALPMFRYSLRLVSTMYQQCRVEHFAKLVEDLQITALSNGGDIAAVITRPPEIVILFFLTLRHNAASRSSTATSPTRNVFAVFDSHSRSNGKAVHPDGLAFVFIRDPDELVEYLVNDLFALDPSLRQEARRGHDWQTQLLTQFSAHFLAIQDGDGGIDHDDESEGGVTVEANIELLMEKAKRAQLDNLLSGTKRENVRLERENNEIRSRLRAQSEVVRDLRAQVSKRAEGNWTTSMMSRIAADRWKPTEKQLSAHDVDEDGFGIYPVDLGPDVSKSKVPDRSRSFSLASASSTSSVGGDSNNQNTGFLGRMYSSAKSMLSSPDRSNFWQQQISQPHATELADAQLSSLRARVNDDASFSQTRQNLPAWRRDDADKGKGKGKGKSREVGLHVEENNRLLRNPTPANDRDFTDTISYQSDSISIDYDTMPAAPTSGSMTPIRRSAAGTTTALNHSTLPTSPISHSDAFEDVPPAYHDMLIDQEQRLSEDEHPDDPSHSLHRFGTAVQGDQASLLHEDEDDYEVALRTQMLLDNESRVLSREREDLIRYSRRPANSREQRVGGTPNMNGARSDFRPPDTFRDLPPARRTFAAVAGRDRSTVRVEDQSERALSELRSRMAEDEARMLADHNLAVQLAREDDEIEREHRRLITESQPTFECSICMEMRPLDSAMPIPTCTHVFCRGCLKSHVVSKLEEGRYPIFCPICSADKNMDQKGEISNTMAESLGLSEEQYVMWEKLNLAQYSVWIDCPHCEKSSLVDRDDFQISSELRCPLPTCRGMWCKKCMNFIDPSAGPHSCDGQAEMDRYIATGSATKRCPGCTTPTEKTEGCNHMTCSVPGCNTHFCWVCGKTIVRTQIQSQVKSALEAHYRKCKLFHYPA